MSKPKPPTTMQERWDLLDLVAQMIAQDFGVKDSEEHFEPFSSADIARHGMTELAAAYRRFTEVEEIADDVLASNKGKETYSDNLDVDELHW